MQGRDKDECFQDHSRLETVCIVGSLLAPVGAIFLWVVLVTWVVQGLNDAVGLAWIRDITRRKAGARRNGVEHDDCNDQAEEEDEVLGVHLDLGGSASEEDVCASSWLGVRDGEMGCDVAPNSLFSYLSTRHQPRVLSSGSCCAGCLIAPCAETRGLSADGGIVVNGSH